MSNPDTQFVENLKTTYLQFENRLTIIQADKNKGNLNKLNFCIIDDTIELYNDICIHLNKLSTDPEDYDEEELKEKCYIPSNPYMKLPDGSDPPLPMPGYYEGNVTSFNISEVIIEYKRFYTDPNTGNDSLLNDLTCLFEELFNTQNLQNIEDCFVDKKNKLSVDIKNGQLINIPVVDLILCWKEVCRHLLKLRGKYDRNLFESEDGDILIPGPRCDMPEDKPIRKETDPSFDPYIPQDPNGVILFEFLCQPFFNGASGGKDINGSFLQMLVTNHYFNICSKVVEPLCALFQCISEQIICEKKKIIPFDFSDILDPEECEEKKFIRIKKLFGTENQISNLLHVVCEKINEIHDFYKEVKCLPASVTQPFIASYVSSKWENPIVLKTEPNQQGVGFKVTIVVLSGPDCIMEEKIKNKIKISDGSMQLGLYDELDKCKMELQEFIDELNKCRDQSLCNFDKKEEKTAQVLDEIQTLLTKFKETSGDADKWIDVNSGKVDINLLVSYKRYLYCLTKLRCDMLEILQSMQSSIGEIEEEHDAFHDVLVCSEYYKCILAQRWLVSEDGRHKKLPLGLQRIRQANA